MARLIISKVSLIKISSFFLFISSWGAYNLTYILFCFLLPSLFRFFISFVLSIFIGLLINLSFTAYSLSIRDTDYASYKLRTQNNAISKYSSNLFLGLAVTALVFNIIAGIFSAELLIYHIWLRCTGRTTYEHIVERRKRAEVNWIEHNKRGKIVRGK